MKLGLAIADFTWPGRPLAPTLREIAVTAEEAGFTRIAVMDHLWQIGSPESATREMLESYTTLGYLAASTTKVELLTLVTAATYREPGLLAKIVTTLDVLSGGRAWLGIGAGAAFNVEEASGLGLPFPATAERMTRLEETLQICLQMWRADDDPYRGRYYSLDRTLNSPQSVRRPHPPILIGGDGERKTLRLVAQYADACNLFATPELPRKLDVLRAHCDAVGRPYEAIEKTIVYHFNLGERGGVGRMLADLQRLAQMGFDHAIGTVLGRDPLRALQIMGDEIVPRASEL